MYFLILSFRRVLDMVFFLLGNSPASVCRGLTQKKENQICTYILYIRYSSEWEHSIHAVSLQTQVVLHDVWR
jgi:hypothetical protein